MIALTLDEVMRAMRGRPCAAMTAASVQGASIDSRTCDPGDLFFAVPGERFDGHDFVDQALERGALAAVMHRVDADERRRVIRVDDTVAAMGRLAAFHRRQCGTHVIAVTGSNGKTTVKCMIDHVLARHMTGRAAKRSFNNAVGVPVTLLSARRGDAYLVVEIGSNAKGEIAALAETACPHIGVITSVGRAHLEGLTDLRGVAVEKTSLLCHLAPRGLAVVNSDIPDIQTLVKRCGSPTTITFGANEDADVRVSDVAGGVDEVRFVINGKHHVRLPVPGEHSATNAAAAFAVCRRMGVEADAFADALGTFQPAPLRLNVWRGRITLIDDSYNANPDSMIAAASVLACASGGRRVVVAGDMLELGDAAGEMHRDVGRRIVETGCDVLIGVGLHAAELVAGAREASSDVETLGIDRASAACDVVPERIEEGDTVLVKGSRRLGLDRLAAELRERFA